MDKNRNLILLYVAIFYIHHNVFLLTLFEYLQCSVNLNAVFYILKSSDPYCV